MACQLDVQRELAVTLVSYWQLQVPDVALMPSWHNFDIVALVAVAEE